MPSQGEFAQTAPASGSIRVFFQTINNKDVVKALTVSDVDKDGDDISISLTELDVINLPLSASGVDVTLQVDSIIQKPGYHFIGVQDITVNSLSGSDNAPISITPYLTETFFYNDYNAIISNASSTRTSRLRYDVDRSGGQVKPSNYNAIAGIESLTINGMETVTGGVSTPFASHTNYSTNGGQLPSPHSNVASIVDDKDYIFRVGPGELKAAIGNTQNSIVSASQAFFDTGGELSVTSTFKLRFSSRADFNSFAAGAQDEVVTLAEQVYVNGDIQDSIFSPGATGVVLNIDSGSFNGNIYMRLEQTNTVNNILGNTTFTITPLLLNNLKSNNFLTVNILPKDNILTPFAPLAPVQDSNYSSTGIVNARYNGTKTTQQDYSGIEPAIGAAPFEAAVYTLNENDNFICSQSLADRDIKEFLFIGEEDLPGASITNLGTVAASNVLSSGTDTTFDLAVADLGLRKQIRPGDVLEIVNGSNSELIQVELATLPAPGSIVMNITVLRNYNNSVVSLQAYPANSQVSRFSNTRIFEIKGNRLLASTGKKIWVKENRTILKTSESGYVTELSATCSV